MKRIQIIIVLLLLIGRFCFAQNLTSLLFDFKDKSFPIANEFSKNCITNKFIQQDTLYIEIFSQFDCHKLYASAVYEKDTLNLICYNDYIEKNETKFNKETGEYTTTITMNPSICCGKCGFILTFKLSSDFKNKPILFNNKMISECINNTQFELINRDTINKVDKLGMRQGAWMTFFDNGNLATLDTFRNDQIIIGYKFDKAGKTIAKTNWDGYQTWTFESLTDTIFFRDLLHAPVINKKNE
jgi:hypothetical protein